MFTTNHFLWMGISLAAILGSLALLRRRRLPLRTVLTALCVLAVLSEYTKVFSTVEMLPRADAEGLYPFLDLGHLPFHLCSLQILLIFYVRFARPSAARDAVLAFMYPTCTAGAFFALLLPSIFPGSVAVSDAFRHPLAYQYFLWHSALIVLGLYIPLSGELRLTPKRCLTTCGLLTAAAFLSLYVNAACSSPVYVGGRAVSLDFVTNFFFTMQTPIGISLMNKGHWLLYFGILHVVGWSLVALLYLPFMCGKEGKS